MVYVKEIAELDRSGGDCPQWFVFLTDFAAFIYWATGFLGTYSKLQAGDTKMH